MEGSENILEEAEDQLPTSESTANLERTAVSLGNFVSRMPAPTAKRPPPQVFVPETQESPSTIQRIEHTQVSAGRICFSCYFIVVTDSCIEVLPADVIKKDISKNQNDVKILNLNKKRTSHKFLNIAISIKKKRIIKITTGHWLRCFSIYNFFKICTELKLVVSCAIDLVIYVLSLQQLNVTEGIQKRPPGKPPIDEVKCNLAAFNNILSNNGVLYKIRRAKGYV